MEQTAVVEVEELSKREKYRERRGEEYEIVSKVAFLIGVSESHWESQYTGLAQDICEQLSENKNARIIRNLCGLRTEIERNFKRFSMLILMELKNLHIYQQNGEVFTGYSNVRGEGKETQRNIYSFVDASEQTVALVDCENCDPLKLCAALQSMQPETLAKIAKIILYNDVNASSAWNLLQKHTKATIEHQMTERVLTGKSLVDVMLVAGCCKEHYMNKVDSFLLFSSDSDYWGLISSVSTAKFLVMVEQSKVSGEVVQKMIDSDIPFCYLDQFCQGGQSHKMKVDALLSECQRFVSKHFESFKVQEMVNVALLQTRIEMSKAEQKQFYERYIKTMRLKIAADGTVSIDFEK